MHNDDGYDEHEEMLKQLAYERVLEKLAAGRTQQTIDEYKRHGDSIMRGYANANSSKELRAKRGGLLDWKAILLELFWNPILFFEYLFAKRDGVMANSWRLYRASLQYWFASRGFFWMAEAVAKISTEGCYTRRNPPPEGARTSAKKMKGVPPKMEVKLRRALLLENSEYAEWAALWIRVGVLFGLRPYGEWFSAVLVPATSTDKAYLLVQNGKYNRDLARGSDAKARMNRAHGPERKIILETVTEEEYALLQKFLSWKDQKTPEEFELAYKGCRDLIWGVGAKLWPRRKTRPALYSCRHQFIANAKKALLSKIEIAALVGHATDETASKVYAKKKRGTPGALRVSAHPEDMERIRQVYEQVDFVSIRNMKPRSNSNPSAENIATVEDAADYSLEDEDDLEEMWEASSDEPDFDPANVGSSEEPNVAEPDSDSKEYKKPKDDPDFSPG